MFSITIMNNNNNNNRLIVDTRIPISRLKTFIATASGQKNQASLDRALLAVVMEEDADHLTPTRVRLLLDAGARPTYRPEIMIEAVFYRYTRVLDLLVERGGGSVKTIRSNFWRRGPRGNRSTRRASASHHRTRSGISTPGHGGRRRSSGGRCSRRRRRRRRFATPWPGGTTFREWASTNPRSIRRRPWTPQSSALAAA